MKSKIRLANLSSLGLAITLASPLQAQRLPLLSDGPGGITCDYHLAAARARWNKRGGDWIDLRATPGGNAPFANASVRRNSHGAQLVTWEVTALVRSWLMSNAPVSAFMLRPLQGAATGSANFRSREFSDTSQRPTLHLSWTDGTDTVLTPAADTSINCTTVKSLGSETSLSVGGNDIGVLIFDLPARNNSSLASATLKLFSFKEWGNGVDVGVFQLHPPWADTSVPERGLAVEHPMDVGLGAHRSVKLTTGFESADWRSRWTHVGKNAASVIVDKGEENGFEPLDGKALRATLLPSDNFALDLRHEFMKREGEEPEAVYFRYYLRFGENFAPIVDGGKLPGFGGTYGRAGWGLRKADGFNGWSARGAFMRSTTHNPMLNDLVAIGSYVYHPELRGTASTTWGWGEGPTGLLQKNRWYSVEQYIEMNVPGEQNGVLKAWINGHKVFEKQGIVFRKTPDLRVESIWFNVYHGGVKKPASPMSLYIDNVVVSSEYIGPINFTAAVRAPTD